MTASKASRWFRSNRWTFFRALTVAGLLVSCGVSAGATELKAMAAAEVRVLQERLRDAQCYAGPIDGQPSGATAEALKHCPGLDPILRIEAGMHTAPIWSVAADRACRVLATGSHDKTVRIWSRSDGKLLRIIRPPIGPMDEGNIHAVTVSPDGTLVATGGADLGSGTQQPNAVYLFEVETGNMKARLGAFDAIVSSLAFSPDGRFLAVGLGKFSGLRVIDVQQAREVAADRDYGNGLTHLSFAPDGRLFTVSLDGHLRGYDQAFRRIGKTKIRSGRYPIGLAVSPSGDEVAVGIQDAVRVEVYRSSNLAFLFAPDTSGLDDGNVDHVAWSADGTQLAAGGSFQMWDGSGQWMRTVAVWDEAGRGKRVERPISLNTIMAMVPCGEGFALGAADPLFGFLDRIGRPRFRKSSVIADLRGKRGTAFQVSADGRRVRFGLEHGETRPVVFDVSRATVTEAAAAEGFAPPQVTGLPVTDWQESMAPRLARKRLSLSAYETSHSLAITPDAKGFVLATSFYLRAFDSRGKQRWQQSMPTDAWGVNVSGDGRLVVSAYADGTIRWHRMSDGDELLAVFVHREDRRWIAWTPTGYYMASPGGEDLIGWHVNRGWNQPADFFPASRFRDRLNRPDVVKAILDTLDEATAVEETNRAARIRTDAAPLGARLPPVIKVRSPAPGATVGEREVTIEYELRSPSGLPVDLVEVQIDGRPTRGIKRIDPATTQATIERQTVAIPARDVQISLIARAGTLASEPALVSLRWGASPSAAEQQKPRLYGVIVGVSAYRDPALALRYAAKDAIDFAAALTAQKGGLYRDVELKVLTDAQATTSEVKRALSWLERQAGSGDIGIVFLAGHGVADAKNRYYYLTADAERGDLSVSALDGTTLRERTRALAGKVLVFLDTCYAGQAMTTSSQPTDINSVVNELSSAENGVVTFASSTGREVSQEDAGWGNGAFTKALLEGLPAAGRRGKADLFGRGTITTAQLNAWLANRVKELTGGSQHPVMILPATIPDFPLFAAGL